jgi:hypothetical protein
VHGRAQRARCPNRRSSSGRVADRAGRDRPPFPAVVDTLASAARTGVVLVAEGAGGARGGSLFPRAVRENNLRHLARDQPGGGELAAGRERIPLYSEASPPAKVEAELPCIRTRSSGHAEIGTPRFRDRRAAHGPSDAKEGGVPSCGGPASEGERLCRPNARASSFRGPGDPRPFADKRHRQHL